MDRQLASDGPAADDGARADANADANADAGPPCDLAKPFLTPALVPAVNAPSTEYGAWLSPDERTIWIARDDGDVSFTQVSIYTATRTSRTAIFDTPKLATDLTAPGTNLHVSLTADLLTIFIASTRTGTMGAHDLFVSTRGSPSALFPKPEPVANVNTTANDYTPAVLGDGSVLYFASNQPDPNGADFDIYRSVKQGSAFGTPARVEELRTTDTEDSPVASQDERIIFFRRGNDVWRASRASATDPFAQIEAASELNAAGAFTTPLWLSPDGCRIYVASDRAGGIGSRDVWMAQKPSAN